MPFPQPFSVPRLFIASMLVSFSLSGCGDGGGDTSGPDGTGGGGSLTVTVTTSGSSVDNDGYTLMVDGAGAGALNGSSPVTVTGLAVGNHAVGLTGIADNCQVQGDNPRQVPISSEGTTSVAFVVICTTPPPGTGSIQVSTSTTGPNPDPDGYTATIDGTSPIPLPANGSATFPSVTAGNHTVTLSGVAPNCTASGGGSASITVSAGAASQVSFTVTCTAISPSTGTLRITTSTSGADPDGDGYKVAVDGGQAQAIGVNGQVELANALPGVHTAVLSDIAANCSADNASKTVTVVAGATATVAFSITCTAIPPSSGTLRITTTTTGPDPDGDGYKFAVDGGPAQTIGVNAQVNVANASAGVHTVVLSDIAANCSPDNTSKTATVVAGATATLAFTITCTAIPPTVGSIRVTTTTTGTNPDADGYQFAVDGRTAQHIDPTDAVTVSGIPTGAHRVVLSNVAANCTVDGGLLKNVTVNEGQTVEATFAIACRAPQPSASRSTVLANPRSILVATGSSTITVTVKDAGGGPLSGVPVTITGTGDGNTITPVSPTTDQEGKATFSFSSTVAGKKTITAKAAGVTLTNTEVITVIMQGSVTQVTIAPEPSTSAESFTATVRVSSRGEGTPTGTVNVFSFALTGGCDNVALNGDGVATCTFPASPAGTYRIEAAYSGDDQFEESSGSADHVVVAPATSNQRASR